MVLLPTDNVKDGNITINKEIMALHKENVDVAVANWNNFMNNIFNALKMVIDVTGLSKSEVLEDFRKPVEIEGQTTKS